MDVASAIDLLDSLAESIRVLDGHGGGHPSGLAARRRAQGIAEREALRRLYRTASVESALAAGTKAYEREMRYFSPLTLLHDETVSPSVERNTVDN